MAIEEVTRYRTSDGEEFSTRAAAETHEEEGEYVAVCDEVGAAALIADPLSTRAQAFEKLGGEIRKARYARPGGKRFERKTTEKPAVSPAAAIDPEKMGDMSDGNTATIDDVMGAP
jgi:hypothetical protein